MLALGPQAHACASKRLQHATWCVNPNGLIELLRFGWEFLQG